MRCGGPRGRPPATVALAAALGLWGCASPESGNPDHDREPGEPDTAPAVDDRSWESPGFHLRGRFPSGWLRRQVEDPGILSIAREDATVDLRVLILDATSARPDEDILARLAPDGWSRESGSRFEFLGTQAVRGDFAGADGLTTTQILWEAHEGARPGRKFLFHAVLVCPASIVAVRRREFDEFLSSLEADLDGPATEPVRLALDEGWEVVTRPARRALSLSGFGFPLPSDPFQRRNLPVAASLDAADLGRERHAAGEPLGHEELLDGAIAHYNVALHQLWSQVGAPEERREGQRASPREALELSTRMHAALTLNLTLRAKLGAMRTNRPWRDVERLKQNATVLEALAEWFRGRVLTGEIRGDLSAAAAAPVGDYRELAFAVSRGIDPGKAAVAARLVQEGHAALAEGRTGDAEEAGRGAIAATGGAWADGWRLAAAALYAEGRLDAAAGASRRATTALPDSAVLHLEHAEILIASGRPDDALEVLGEHDGMIRDALPEFALIHAALTASAHLRAGRNPDAAAAAQTLATRWETGPADPPRWDFHAFERALPADAPWRTLQLSLHALLRNETGVDAFRRTWGLPDR